MVRRDIAAIGTTAKTATASVNLMRRSLLGLGGLLILTSSIRTIAQFEQALSTTAAVAKATESQFDQLRDSARDLGATTRFTATQAAEGLLFLSRAGFTVQESLEAIRPTLLLAQAGALDLGRSADIVTNIMKGFRLEADQTSRAVDVLALAATSSNTTVEELGDAMKFVAPIAAGLGVTLEETAAAVGSLANAGLKASLAGTGLRRVLAELESPSKKTTKQIAELGISVERGEISALGMFAALTKLKEAGVDTGRALEIFGQRGGPAFEVLSEALDETKEFADALLNAEGTVESIAAIMDDNLNGALLRVKSAFEAVILSIGQFGASSALTVFLEVLADSLRFLARNIQIVEGLLLGLAIAVIPKVILGLRALTAAIFSTGIGAIAVLLGTAIGTLIAFRDEILVTGDGLTSFGDLSTAVFERMQETATILVNAIGDLFGNQFLSDFAFTFEDIGTLFEIFVRGVARSLDAVLATFLGLRFGLEAAFRGLPSAVEEIVIAAMNGVIGTVEFGVDTVLALFQTLGDTTLRVATQINLAFVLLAASAQNALVGNLTEAKRLGDEAAFQLSTGLVNAIEDVPRRLADNFEALSETDLIPRIKNVATGAGAEFAEDFLDSMSQAMEESTIFQDSVGDIFERAGDIGRERQLRDQRERDQVALEAASASGGGPGLDPEQIEQDTTSVVAGFQRGLATLKADINDFASLTEAAMVNAFSGAEDALVSFVQTGKVDFSSLVDSMLADLTRLIARQALVAALGALSGGSGAAASAAISARANGGPVEPGKQFLVGEEGPELFSPSSRGNITPAAQTAAMMSPQAPPVVNVQVVNLTDPNEVTAALATPEGQEAILNVIRRNPRALREIS